jgi:nicotinamidase-related amidase
MVIYALIIFGNMKVKSWLILIVLSFALGAGGGWYLQGEKQSVSATPHNLPAHAVEFDLPKLKQNALDYVFQIKTTSRSYFARDETGSLIPELRNGKKFYKVGENVYNFSRPLHTNKTALIVMDPWEDSGSSFLNDYYEPVTRKKLIPLINKSINLGIPVVVLTNSPLESADYSNKVAPEIENLAKQGKLSIIYHQSTDSKRFSEWLRSMGIDTLIYSGFASNMCVIGRDLGMIPMQLKGFRLFFVPEASAAVEFQDSWKNGALHESTTLMISQWVGELIKLNDFLSLSETLQK